MIDRLTYWFAELVAAVRCVLGILVLLLAVKVCYVLALMAVPQSWGLVHLTRILPALGLIAVGTLLLDGRGRR